MAAAPRFLAQIVDNFERNADSEKKVLEEIASRIPQNASGTVYIYTERVSCESCASVVNQFTQQFPNIRVVVEDGGMSLK